jgi:AcrR family transcriptional regulator
MTTEADDIRRRVIDAALTLAAERPWPKIALGDIAQAAGLGLIELYRIMPSKAAILAGFVQQIDAAMLAAPCDLAEAPRDRLFDLLMRRFDALSPHRAGLRGILRGPLSAAPMALCLPAAMRWALEAAGLAAPGLTGVARAKILGLAHLAAVRSFLDDDTPDLARTMAALDGALRRAEPWLRLSSPPAEAKPATA